MPTTSPLKLNSGPPDLPGLIGTYVWMKGTRFSLGNPRPLALTIPAVEAFSGPDGVPTAPATAPLLRWSVSLPRRRGGVGDRVGDHREQQNGRDEENELDGMQQGVGEERGPPRRRGARRGVR